MRSTAVDAIIDSDSTALLHAESIALDAEHLTTRRADPAQLTSRVLALINDFGVPTTFW